VFVFVVVIIIGKREYLRAINSAVTGLSKSRGQKLTFLKDFEFNPGNIHFESLTLNPSPTAILTILCKQFLHANVSAILYMMNYEQYGRSTASAQYFLQLAGYLGIPVISWNADNSGLERRASQSTLQLQLAPSIEHQAAAMLSILERYKWHQFSIVTSQIAGHDDFVQAIREHVAEMQERFKFTILNSIIVTRPSDLTDLINSEARVMLLYCTKSEAIDILKGNKEAITFFTVSNFMAADDFFTAAETHHLTGENYVWVVTQSVIENTQPHSSYPVGSGAAAINTAYNPILLSLHHRSACWECISIRRRHRSLTRSPRR
jgi:ionotropic glutamate receptor NMDA 2B